MREEPLFVVNENKCISCYACVRVCPVKAIEVKVNSDTAKILPKRCVGCGSCLNICPVEAISYRESLVETKEILSNTKEKKCAIVAPSISGEFSDINDYRKFVRMIKALGFNYVNEVSFGVDIIATKYKELFEDYKGKYYLSANCPVVVEMVERFYPELITNLAPIVSPMIATAKIVREKYGENIKVVYIGPCIANKEEIYRYEGLEKVDSVLTFRELRLLFDEFNIKESHFEFSEFDAPIGNKGSLYPISNGIIQTGDMNEDLLSGNIITVRGRNSVVDALKQFANNTELIKRHFNLFYCEGCLMGPGTSHGGERFIRRSLVVDYANKRISNLNLDEWSVNVDKYKDLTYKCRFQENIQRIETPSEEEIQEILSIIEKKDSNPNVGCQSCGYDSCREFAIAVSKGLAKVDMCLTHSQNNRNKYINTLRATNTELSKIQKALKESEKKALKEKEIAKEASEITSAMLQKLPSGVVILDNELKIIESNDSFIELLGEDVKEIAEIIPGLKSADLKTLLPYNLYNLFTYALTHNEEIVNKDVHYIEKLLNVSVFTIKKGKIVGAVLRDMYAPEVQKEEMLSRITDVIDNNLNMVQKIGFLLGEGAAETERMLNSIIQTYKQEKNPHGK